MLVLKRAVRENTIIKLPDGREISVILTEIVSSSQAKIGFIAPPDVIILREEVIKRMEKEEKQRKYDNDHEKKGDK